MFLGVLVKARGVGIQYRSCVLWQIGVVAFCCAARIDHMVGIVKNCAIFAGNCTVTSARHGNDILEREEIILSMRIGNAKCRIRIGFAVNHRHAKFVAHDLGRIFARFGL